MSFPIHRFDIHELESHMAGVYAWIFTAQSASSLPFFRNVGSETPDSRILGEFLAGARKAQREVSCVAIATTCALSKRNSDRKRRIER